MLLNKKDEKRFKYHSKEIVRGCQREQKYF